MFAKSFYHILWVAGPVFTALVLLGSPESALAQKKRNKQAAQAVNAAQVAQVVTALRSVKLTLEKADHDYGGHRAAAVRDIKAAIHQLTLTHHHLHKGKTGGKNGGVKFGGEAQVLSDSQLAAAMPPLRQMQITLQQTPHDLGGHRANAIRDLGAAIMQLDRALQYSAVRNRKKF